MMYDEFDFITRLDTDKGEKQFNIYVKSSFERHDEQVTIEGVSVHELGGSNKFNILPVIEIFNSELSQLINSEALIRAIQRVKEIKAEVLNG